jgi:hypothetical protein
MLHIDHDPTRRKCSFVAHLNASAKTFNGEASLGVSAHDQWAFSIEINS